MQQQCFFLLCSRFYRRLSSVSKLCWKCGQDLNNASSEVTFTCPCPQKVLVPLQTKNYFTILSCKQGFQVDVKCIRQMYHRLQVLLHPDKYTQSHEKEQEIALENSGIVNKAHNTLTNPYHRGLYLLELRGITIDEKDNMSTDLDFLEEMMSLNEEVSECNDQKRLGELKDSIEGNIDDYVTDIGQAFANGDHHLAKDGLARLKYYINLKQELQNKLLIS